MRLHASQIESAAESLFQAERRRHQIGLLSGRFPGLGMDDAYRIQEALIERKLASGRKIIGWKIGLTSRAMQKALNIETPDSGALLDDMHFLPGATIAKDRFIEPRVEVEIAFGMKSDLAGAGASRQDVLDATAWVAPALELLDTRVYRTDPDTGRPRNVCDTIADNAANAGLVVGESRHQPAKFDLRWIGAILLRNDKVEETGLGAGVLNDPPTSVLWLVHRLAEVKRGLRAGDVVLSGSFTRPVEAPPGSRISADFGEFGSVDCNFAL